MKSEETRRRESFDDDQVTGATHKEPTSLCSAAGLALAVAVAVASAAGSAPGFRRPSAVAAVAAAAVASQSTLCASLRFPFSRWLLLLTRSLIHLLQRKSTAAARTTILDTHTRLRGSVNSRRSHRMRAAERPHRWQSADGSGCCCRCRTNVVVPLFARPPPWMLRTRIRWAQNSLRHRLVAGCAQKHQISLGN